MRVKRHRRGFAQLPRRAAAAITALCVGGLTSAFLGPVPLLHPTATGRHGAGEQSLLAGQEVYLKLGASAPGTASRFYRIASVHLSMTSGHVGLQFKTSSLVLLGEILRAGGGSGSLGAVSLAFRSPDPGGRPTTEQVETFAEAEVGSFDEHLSGAPTGSVSLVLPVLSHVVRAPEALRLVTEFADASVAASAPATKVYVRLSSVGVQPVTAVEISQGVARGPLSVSFATSSVPLLDAIFHGEGSANRIPVVKISVRTGGRDGPVATALTDTFAGMSVGSFAENLSGSVAGTATLVSRPR